MTICPFGMVTTSPLAERIRVIRSVTSSTVPAAGSPPPDHADRDDVAEAVLPLGDDEEPGEHVAARPAARRTRARRPARWPARPGRSPARPSGRSTKNDRDGVDQHDRRPRCSTWVSECRCLAASERTSASPPVACASMRSVIRPPTQVDEPGQQDRAQHDQHDLQPAATDPVGQVRQRGEREDVHRAPVCRCALRETMSGCPTSSPARGPSPTTCCSPARRRSTPTAWCPTPSWTRWPPPGSTASPARSRTAGWPPTPRPCTRSPRPSPAATCPRRSSSCST